MQPWFSDFQAFVQMGRHGAYVWPAFGITALALAWEWWALRRRARAVRLAEGTP
ncbi:MAG: heme exporter protein CcmD [Pseudomonadota bacterium]|nr:heme exporter protein CcmD [Pseudomonadota bacterium]